MNALTHALRDDFESRVFRRHYLSTIKRTGLDGPSTFMPRADLVLTKVELFELGDDGDYKRNYVSAMWFGWCEAIEQLNGVRLP